MNFVMLFFIFNTLSVHATESCEKFWQYFHNKSHLNSKVIDGRKAVFHRVEAGDYKGPIGRVIYIPQSFDMMATPITQIVWRHVARLANQKLQTHIPLDPSRHKGGLRPVESLLPQEVQAWIQALNVLSRLASAELKEIFPDHKKGDVYVLPTQAQWEFVALGRGVFEHSSGGSFDFDKAAWFLPHSNHQTHPVGQKEPISVDDKDFYDMYGNVWELTSSVVLNEISKKPQYYVYCGGSCVSENEVSLLSRFVVTSYRFDDAGFRLIRQTK